MPNKEITVKIIVDADTPVRLKDKEEILKRISNLPKEDQQRIITICENPKALKALADNWPMLQGMFS